MKDSKNRLAEIFSKFMDRMHRNGSDIKKARIELVRDGHSPIEIDSALEWYFGEMHRSGNRADDGGHGFKMPSQGSMRHFTLEERRYLSSEAITHLTEMSCIGAITLPDVEELVDTLRENMIEDASVEDIEAILSGFHSVDLAAREGSEDSIEFKIRYLQ